MKKKEKLSNILLPLFLLFFSVYVFIEGHAYRGSDKYFPMLLGCLVFIVSVWMIIEELAGKGKPISFSEINWKGILLSIAAMVVYVFLFPRIGYVTSTFLLGICIIKGLGYKSWIGAILWPAFLVGVTFVIFKILLKVPLPTLLGA